MTLEQIKSLKPGTRVTCHNTRNRTTVEMIVHEEYICVQDKHTLFLRKPDGMAWDAGLDPAETDFSPLRGWRRPLRGFEYTVHGVMEGRNKL